MRLVQPLNTYSVALIIHSYLLIQTVLVDMYVQYGRWST